MNKLRVGILGATGMVGQRFITLLEQHPWFEMVCLAASPASRGKTYEQAVTERWLMTDPIPDRLRPLTVLAVEDDLRDISSQVDLVFSALDLDKERIKKIEETYAQAGIAVVSNNSAHRWTADVPLIIPEVNPHHIALIAHQRKQRGWKKGLIVVKPNCSIQSYVCILQALALYQPQTVQVTSLQAISGAGKTFATWPQMQDTLIPYIAGEEEKSEQEPLKIWGTIANHAITKASVPTIAATCIRVPVSDGHLASISVSFGKKPRREDILAAVTTYQSPIAHLHLPSAPTPLITYQDNPDRPQVKEDRLQGNGMGITMGRLREQSLSDWSFIALAHNTIRGAAGGAILTAELLKAQGYL